MLRKIKKRVLWLILSICLVLFFIWGLAFRLILPTMWNFLVVNETPEHSDVIIVLSGDTGRVEHGVRLYQQGYADMMLYTGSGAQSMRRRAMSLGVADDHILVERKSYTTFKNAQNSWEVVQAQGYKSAMVVTSAYQTRRASIIFAQFFQGVELIISSVPYDSSTPQNWWKDRHVSADVISEYLKIVWHYLFER